MPEHDHARQAQRAELTPGDATFLCESPHPLLERDSLTPEERSRLLAEYVTRGRALQLAGDRGLVDSHRRRVHNLAQFFTPAPIVRVMSQALGLVEHPAWQSAGRPWARPEHGSLVDFAGCGNGRMFQYAPAGWTLHGADVDPLACRAARLIYPDAEILEASLVEFSRRAPPYSPPPFTLAMLNPPFSITLSSRRPLDLACAQWGLRGRGTSAPSHLAALELGTRLARVVATVLPTAALADGDPLAAAPDARHEFELKLRIDLPLDAFESEGTRWPCSIAIFGSFAASAQQTSCSDWTAVDAALTAWIVDQARTPYGNVRSVLGDGDGPPPSLSSWRVHPEPPRLHRAVVVDAPGQPAVRLALGGRGHQIRMLPNNLRAALSLEEARLRTGWITSDGFDPQARLDWMADLVRNAGSAEDAIAHVASALRSVADLEVAVDAQLVTHARRADRRAAVELTPFTQWVRRGDAWEEQGRDARAEEHPAASLIAGRTATFRPRAEALPSGLTVKTWSRRARAHVERAWPAFPVYDFARADIVRVLGKRSALYSAKQGLGKTRFSIGAALASGASCVVWLLETRLVGEFKRELRGLGLLHLFHQIETKRDLAALRTFNVITYSRVWRDVNEGAEKRTDRWGPGKSFAAALGRRRPFVILDEAHKIANATSKQGIAARHLCNRARRVLLMTGTAISSYPRNLVGLVAAGWGEGGGALNPYGYRRPVEGGYYVDNGRSRRLRNPLIKGITAFVDKHVDVIWYTPAFADTASAGMKSREIPRLKNVPLWESFTRSKIIRRVPGEPEVRASGLKTPEARPVFVPIEPTKEHFAYYKLVLDHFAEKWKKRLEDEASTGRSSNSIAHILPELDALRFASTVPVTRHRWADEDPLLRYGSTAPTALMLHALTRVWNWVAQGDRVIVSAEKPDALRWFADLLAAAPSYVPESEPVPFVLAHEPNIAKRTAMIDRARDSAEGAVLLLSVGMGKEGLNLAAYSKLLTLDLGWVPGALDQLDHRILRPDQAGEPEIEHLYHRGMIDEYMRQLTSAKSDAIAQCIDRQESTFDYGGWKDYRTFALELLANEGYEFAAKALAAQRSRAIAA